MSAERYDIAIVGAGPAGSATALALLRGGARVALVERCREPQDRMGESLRGVASEMLRELGVWDDFQRLEQRPSYLHRAAWGGRFEERPAIRLRYGPDLHLDRARFDALLLEKAVARGAELFRPGALRAVSETSEGVKVSLVVPNGRVELLADNVIDATGHGASVARRFGAVRHSVDRLIGIARSFDRGAREPTTLVEAADLGWWYTAPQPRGRMVALFITDGDSPARSARSSETWQRCLASAPRTQQILTAIENPSVPQSYLTTPSVLDWDTTRSLLPVGDAALSFDPIAADGLCFALRSGLEAAAHLLRTKGSAQAYKAGIHSIFHAHLARREHIYASERSVRPTPFWLRSRAGAVAHERTGPEL